MNTTSAISFHRRVARALLVGVAIGCVSLPGMRAFGATASAAEPKTHTLYMGMDFDVQRGKEFHRVTDVVGGSFILRIKGEIVRVPVVEKVNLRITQSLKLATTSAEIKGLKAERAYTPANDPRVKWMAAMSAMRGAAADNTQAAARSMNAASAGLQVTEAAQRAAGRAPGGMGAAAMQSSVDAARADAGSATANFNNAVGMEGTMSNSAFYVSKMDEELKQELFDAVEVDFEISSPKPLANPYVVVVVQFHAPNAPQDMAQNWIYAEAIEQLDGSPRKFHIKNGGFPPGYALERFQVHVYDRGREVASSVAPKRVDLTSSEAYEYLLIEHLAMHKRKDAAAAAALGNFPADFRQKLPPGDIGRIFYAKVNKDGIVTGVFIDEACRTPLETPYTVSIIQGIRYLPALADGLPVDGVAKVKLNDIRI